MTRCPRCNELHARVPHTMADASECDGVADMEYLTPAEQADANAMAAHPEAVAAAYTEMLVDQAATVLRILASDPKAPPEVRVGAAAQILDRAYPPAPPEAK